MPPLVKNMADTALLFVLFFAVGLATRLPALSLQELYGLHAVLAAPLYSLAIAASIRSRNALVPTVIAALCYGFCLGMMHPVMALSAILPAAAAAIAYAIARGAAAEKRALVTGSTFGIAVYPSTIAGALWFNAVLAPTSASGIIQWAALFCIAVAASVLAAIAGCLLTSKVQALLEQAAAKEVAGGSAAPQPQEIDTPILEALDDITAGRIV